MPKAAFTEFEKVAKEIAENWPQDIQYESRPGTQKCYGEAMRKFFQRISKRGPEALKNGGVEHGLRVMGNFLYVAAVKSAENNMTKQGLEITARHPETIQTLGMIAIHSNAVASAAEKELGLMAYASEISDEQLAHYKVFGYKLKVINWPEIREKAMREAAAHGYPTELSLGLGCPAHKNHTLEKVYKDTVKISSKDPNLFDATLKNLG